jgi:glycerol-3-phosphate O-acyltransferase
MSQKKPIADTKVGARVRGWIESLLGGTYHHYSCVLPKQPGTLSGALLKMFFSGITVAKDQTDILANLPEDAIIVYVNKHKSKFEFLFFHTHYSQKGMRAPEIAFDYRIFFWQPISRLFRILLAHSVYSLRNFSFLNPYANGYIRQELLNGRPGFLSLVEKGEFYRRFVKSKLDPIRLLVEIQKTIDRPICLVPQLVFFGKAPLRSNPTIIDILLGTEGKPGLLRRLITLFRNPGKVFVEISAPINLREFLDHPDQRNASIAFQSLYLRRNLLRQINRHRQTITGPVLKSLEELKESILTTERLQEFMEKQAETKTVPIYQIRKEADGYLEEIAAKYSTALIKIAAVIVGYIIDTMFDGVSMNSEGIKFVKTAYQKGPLILIPCHKSHIDYLILSYTLYQNNMPCPHVAAGKNLSFWPMGPLFRRGGAFFIRRSFRGAVLYSKVFAEYLFKLLQEGFNIEFFIEGTRSRTGKLILPKLGFLSMLLEAYRNGACEDMIFVPIYIGYDRVLEESAYVQELEGRHKEPENFFQVLRARKFLKKRYGRIYIRFHEPLSLNTLLEQRGTNLLEMPAKEKNAFCRDLGFRIVNSINKSTVITAHGLCAAAILNTYKSRFTLAYLKFIVATYLKYLHTLDAALADTLLIDQHHAVDNALDSYIQRKFIEPVTKGKDDAAAIQYSVNVGQRSGLEYYKNNCISFFVPAAFTALEILNRDAFQFSAADVHPGFRFLKKLFKYDFAYDIDVSDEHFVRKSIKAFIDDAILMPHPTLPDTYNVTSAGFRKLRLFASFLTPYFESYSVVLSQLMQTPRDAMDAKTRLKKIEARGRRMYKRKEIECREALSKVNYQNAMDFFSSQSIKGSEDDGKGSVYAETMAQYLNLLQ